MEHITVLLQESINSTITDPKGVYIDGTLGASGHTDLFLKNLGPGARLLSFDLDEKSILYAKEKFNFNEHSNTKNIEGVDLTLVHENFQNISSVLKGEGLKASGILLDLGWNQDQFDSTDRGFSFRFPDAPLDMRYGNGDVTAKDLVNHWDKKTLESVIQNFSDERFARQIAEKIVEYRQRSKDVGVNTVGELVSIIESAVPSRFAPKGIHVATKTFQALRMATNDEIGVLKNFLDSALSQLELGGRISIITFHSGEDRIVKNYFKQWEKDGIGNTLFKKGQTPSKEEISKNRRSRSSRLRVFQKKARLT